MKKVNIMTFCTWTSIGSILQAFALKQALAKNECLSTILLPSCENRFFTTRIHSMKTFLSRFFQVIIHRERKEAYRKRCNFIERELDIVSYENDDQLIQLAQQDTASCYLAGSDQIWHPDRCEKRFFLDFVRSGKCISYAASMGKTEIRPENLDKFRMLMQRMERISVRETQCRDVLQPLTEKNIEVHIDPTFLLDAEAWRQHEAPYPVRTPYILVYMIYWHPSCKEQLQALKRSTGLPVYAICSGLSRVYADRRFFDVGVEEFLWLIDHAEYVVTSSFHGVAMSAIFGKKFSAVVNPDAPSRIRNLLQTLGIPEVPIHELDTTKLFDQEMILTRIAEERENGMQYLKEAVGE